MIHKKPLIPQRLRSIQGSFAYIEHRFVRDGFFTLFPTMNSCFICFLFSSPTAMAFPFYSYDKLCSLLADRPR